MRAALCLLVLSLGCRPPPVQVERRVPVDLVADCVALRQGLSECRTEAAELLIQRRTAQRPELAEPAAQAALRAEVLAELAREADLPAEERLRQCRLAAAETPPPDPEDVARLHRCLQLGCARRAACLQPLLLPATVPPRSGAGLRSPPG
ncbi:MAG: hypothetical protein RMK29_01740 [Myxococcales bacterium]|nr:hypothetical protein [Myxococcota bacterium]MDW8280402.1 hypothetical protein [Myxococcales bacterium]